MGLEFQDNSWLKGAHSIFIISIWHKTKMNVFTERYKDYQMSYYTYGNKFMILFFSLGGTVDTYPIEAILHHFFHLCPFHLWVSKTSNTKSQPCCAFCIQFLIKPVSVGEYSFWLGALDWSGLAQTVPEAPAAYIPRLPPCKALSYSQIFIRISWLSYVLNTNKVSTGGYAPLCHGLYCGMPRKTLFFKFLVIG